MQCVQLLLGNRSIRFFAQKSLKIQVIFLKKIGENTKKNQERDTILMWMVMNTGRKHAYPVSRSASAMSTADHGKTVTLKMFY